MDINLTSALPSLPRPSVPRNRTDSASSKATVLVSVPIRRATWANNRVPQHSKGHLLFLFDPALIDPIFCRGLAPFCSIPSCPLISSSSSCEMSDHFGMSVTLFDVFIQVILPIVYLIVITPVTSRLSRTPPHNGVLSSLSLRFTRLLFLLSRHIPYLSQDDPQLLRCYLYPRFR